MLNIFESFLTISELAVFYFFSELINLSSCILFQHFAVITIVSFEKNLKNFVFKFFMMKCILQIVSSELLIV